jgi:adenosylcobinamide-GDP ribazoletransferase
MRRVGGEFGAALMLLTRLPAGRLAAGVRPSAACGWAFPLVGIVVGAIAGAAFRLAMVLGLPAILAALLALAVLIVLTGGLHEDGLADTADALGAATPAQSLAIMRDSRIGSFGAAALILSLAYRAAALTTLGPSGAVAALLVSGAAARATMLGLPLLLGPARADGLGREIGHPTPGNGLVAVAITTAVAKLALTWDGVAALALVAASALALVAWCVRQRFGGYTGDTFGALEQLAECAALSVLVIWHAAAA